MTIAHLAALYLHPESIHWEQFCEILSSCTTVSKEGRVVGPQCDFPNKVQGSYCMSFVISQRTTVGKKL